MLPCSLILEKLTVLFHAPLFWTNLQCMLCSPALSFQKNLQCCSLLPQDVSTACIEYSYILQYLKVSPRFAMREGQNGYNAPVKIGLTAQILPPSLEFTWTCFHKNFAKIINFVRDGFFFPNCLMFNAGNKLQHNKEYFS